MSDDFEIFSAKIMYYYMICYSNLLEIISFEVCLLHDSCLDDDDLILYITNNSLTNKFR